MRRPIEDNKQPHLSMNLKRPPIYAKMVEDMLQMTKIQHSATLKCKWEAFKKVILACTNKYFATKHTSWKCTKKCSSKIKWFDKENYQSHFHEYKRLIPITKNMGSYSTISSNARESTCMC